MSTIVPLEPMSEEEEKSAVTWGQFREWNRHHDDIHLKMANDLKYEIDLVAGNLNGAVKRMEVAAMTIEEVRDAICTGLDGSPGMAEEVHRLVDQVTCNTSELRKIKESTIPWVPVLKVMGALSGGIGFLGVLGGSVWWLILKIV
jgi:hypothetical protein